MSEDPFNSKARLFICGCVCITAPCKPLCITGHSCYFYAGLSAVSFTEARTACQNKGAELVAFETKEEFYNVTPWIEMYGMLTTTFCEQLYK